MWLKQFDWHAMLGFGGASKALKHPRMQSHHEHKSLQEVKPPPSLQFKSPLSDPWTAKHCLWVLLLKVKTCENYRKHLNQLHWCHRHLLQYPVCSIGHTMAYIGRVLIPTTRQGLSRSDLENLTDHVWELWHLDEIRNVNNFASRTLRCLGNMGVI